MERWLKKKGGGGGGGGGGGWGKKESLRQGSRRITIAFFKTEYLYVPYSFSSILKEMWNIAFSRLGKIFMKRTFWYLKQRKILRNFFFFNSFSLFLFASSR